jgi:hypothetical protein
MEGTIMALTKTKRDRLRSAKNKSRSVKSAVGGVLCHRSHSQDIEEIGTTFKGCRIMKNIRPQTRRERGQYSGPKVDRERGWWPEIKG